MKSKEIVIRNLINLYNDRGYIKYDNIIEECVLVGLDFLSAEKIKEEIEELGVKVLPTLTENNGMDFTEQIPQDTSSKIVAINALKERYKQYGEINEEDIYNACLKYSVPLFEIDFVFYSIDRLLRQSKANSEFAEVEEDNA